MKNVIISTAVIFTVVVFMACTQSKPKEGQVIGVLYNSDGTRYAEGISVFASAEHASKIDADLSHKTNGKGEFVLDNLQAGNYVLCVCIQPKSDRTPGIDNLPMPPKIGLISNKGKSVHFVLPKNAGLNLGNIEVTEVMQFSPDKSEYETVGSELKYEFDIFKKEEVSTDNQMRINYVITGLKINSHKIDLENVTEIAEQSAIQESSSIITTKNYGPMKIIVHKGGGRTKFSIELLMTHDQKDMIKKLQ